MFHSRLLWSAALTLALVNHEATAQMPPPVPPAPPAAPAKPANKVAATVNGQPIYEAVVQRSLDHLPPSRQSEIRPEVINYLVDVTLLDQYLTQAQVKVEKAEVDKKIDDLKAELKKMKKEFEAFLTENKLTEAEFRDHVAAEMKWEKYVSAQATDKALMDLFTANKQMFDGSMVRARHILLTPPANDAKAAEAAVKQLQTIKTQLEAQVAAALAKMPTADAAAKEKERIKILDEGFAAEAKKVSTCPSKAAGGDVNWFGRAGVMVEPFAKAAFALKPYQMSEPIKTQFGYHLVLVTDRKEGREVKYDDVKNDVKDVFTEKAREAVLEQIRPKAKIEIAPAPAAPAPAVKPPAPPAPPGR